MCSNESPFSNNFSSGAPVKFIDVDVDVDVDGSVLPPAPFNEEGTVLDGSSSPVPKEKQKLKKNLKEFK